MTWSAVVSALDDGGAFRSRVSVYLHPLAGRPIIWHVLRALGDVTPPPAQVRILHRTSSPLLLPDHGTVRMKLESVDEGVELVSLRAAITAPALSVLVDGAAPLITPATIARLLRAAEGGVAALPGRGNDGSYLVVGGEGPALASADDPRRPEGAVPVAATSADELIQVTDRHSLSDASVALRDRLIRDRKSVV